MSWLTDPEFWHYSWALIILALAEGVILVDTIVCGQYVVLCGVVPCFVYCTWACYDDHRSYIRSQKLLQARQEDDA